MINDEESTTESTPLRESHSQGSTWRNLFKKIRILLPYIWPKKSTMLQIRVIFCFILLIGKKFFLSNMDFHKFYYGFIAGVRVINVYVPIYSKKIVDELTEKIFAWDIILALVGLKLLQGLYFFKHELLLEVTFFLFSSS